MTLMRNAAVTCNPESVCVRLEHPLSSFQTVFNMFQGEACIKELQASSIDHMLTTAEGFKSVFAAPSPSSVKHIQYEGAPSQVPRTYN
jgi:hypothetical protein